jgi:hypothetical protein
MVDLGELSYQDSIELIKKFELLENPNPQSMDWSYIHESKATYIWLLEDSINPLGFLSYKILLHPNKTNFIYIVKIYVLKGYKKYEGNKAEEPILIEGKKVSRILFEEIYKKGVNILTLESACEKLDIYYERLGFKKNKEMSDFFAPIIGTNEQIMTKLVKEPKLSDIEKELFGG